jgi:hypothetical protein
LAVSVHVNRRQPASTGVNRLLPGTVGDIPAE